LGVGFVFGLRIGIGIWLVGCCSIFYSLCPPCSFVQVSPSALAKWSSTEASVLVNIDIFVDEVGEAGGVCVEEAAAAAKPGSAFTRMMAGMLGVVVVGICESVGFGFGFEFGV